MAEIAVNPSSWAPLLITVLFRWRVRGSGLVKMTPIVQIHLVCAWWPSIAPVVQEKRILSAVSLQEMSTDLLHSDGQMGHVTRALGSNG